MEGEISSDVGIPPGALAVLVTRNLDRTVNTIVAFDRLMSCCHKTVT